MPKDRLIGGTGHDDLVKSLTLGLRNGPPDGGSDEI